ncbi:MAG: adenylate cyclase [Myxococcales bacterium]|nr:adenylate cyclase [Myxococcales bacterium]
MRLRQKITIAFFLVSSLVSVLLAVFLYRFIERQLEGELRDRLRDIAHIGARSVEVDAYQRLVAQFGTLDDKQVASVEHSPEYKELYAHLRMIRAAEPTLVHYAYLLAPSDDPDNPRFVADADVLELDDKLARGEALPKGEEVSHFNQSYDVSQVPLLKQALVDCTTQSEPGFVWDPAFKVSSVSSYQPLSDDEGNVLRDAKGRCLGVLGVDITDRKMRVALDEAGGLAIKISLAMIALALLVSIAMGTVLTRSIVALSSTVKRFADKDFSARSPNLPRDEVGQLGANFNEMAATIQLHSEHLEDLVNLRTSELTAEKQTSERLLLNVLPGPIADRLKSGENLIVDRFENVSVLFADLVGFTSMSAHTSPEALVTMLNDLFSLFDKLAEQHSLEKIKTIGDAYMVVAGIPQPLADHAVAMAHMAIDMIDGIAAYAKKVNMPLTIRVGIHSGAVVAGVIGRKKFIYDLWGDTVNTASRMESHGVPGRIHVTETTYLALRHQFDFEERPPMEIKGKGLMKTYLLIGILPKDPARASASSIAS